MVVVHYTAMIGIRYQPGIDTHDGTIAIADSMLAIVLVVTVFVICGAFLLVSATFQTSPAQHPAPPAAPAVQPLAYAPTHRATDEPEPASQSEPERANAADTELPEPLEESAPGKSEPDTDTGTNTVPVRIPYEKNKKLWYVDSDDVGAIRADGRYTQPYTRNGVFFCPWSITEAENTLQDKSFYRSHRSYLINTALMSAFEKRKDSGVCLFNDIDQLSKVPVSRTRVSGLLTLVGHGGAILSGAPLCVYSILGKKRIIAGQPNLGGSRF